MSNIIGMDAFRRRQHSGLSAAFIDRNDWPDDADFGDFYGESAKNGDNNHHEDAAALRSQRFKVLPL